MNSNELLSLIYDLVPNKILKNPYFLVFLFITIGKLIRKRIIFCREMIFFTKKLSNKVNLERLFIPLYLAAKRRFEKCTAK